MPNIKDVQIKQFKKGGFRSLHHEGIRHIKVLPYLSIVQSVEGSYDIALGSGETQQTASSLHPPTSSKRSRTTSTPKREE